MRNGPVRFVLMTLLAILFVAGQSEAGRPRLSKPSEKKFEIRRTKYLAGVRVNGGLVSGGFADEISERDGGFYEKLIFGLGILTEYSLTKPIAVGLSVEYGAKTAPTDLLAPITYRSLAGTLAYRFSPDSRSSFCVRSEFGRTSFNASDHELGSHNHVRLAVGEVRATGPTTAARWEIYCKYVFTRGHDISRVPLLPWDDAPFDVVWIGLDLAFTLGF